MNFFTRRPPAANDAIFTAKSHEKIWRKNKLSFYIWRVIVPPPFLAAVYYLISINKTFLYIDRAGAVGFRSRIYVLWTKLSSAREILNNCHQANFTPQKWAGKSKHPPNKEWNDKEGGPKVGCFKKNRMAMAEEEEWVMVSVVGCPLLRTVSSWSYVFLPRGFIVQI